MLKLKRKNDIQKKPNLSIPEFLQDKSKEKKGEIDLSFILDNKIEALKSGKSKKKLNILNIIIITSFFFNLF